MVSVYIATKSARVASLVKGTVVASICLYVGYVVLSNLILTTQPDTPTVDALIDQFEGRAFYWNEYGREPDVFDRFLMRNFDMMSKITAAEMLGEMGPLATNAVPVLIEALDSGPNDIDTGDGVLPYRSTIATALGRIGDTRAIGPLGEKLEVAEPATLKFGATVARSHIGVGHRAVVEALGMFGPQARDAVPHLKRRLAATSDQALASLIERTLAKIEDDS